MTEPTVLWHRDVTPPSRAWQKWALAGAIGLCGFGAFASFMAGDPDSILFMAGGGVALVAMILVAPWLLHRARNIDRELTFDGTTLRCGRQAPVPVFDLLQWTVTTGTDVITNANGPDMRVPWMRLVLVHNDGRTSTFAWSYPSGDDEGTLRAAMTATFGAGGA